MQKPGKGKHATPAVESRRAPTIDFFATWAGVPDTMPYENGFKIEWELFIRHVCEGAPFKWTLVKGAKGVQLAEAGLKSWKERAGLISRP